MTPMTVSNSSDFPVPVEQFRPNPWSWLWVAYLIFNGSVFSAIAVGISLSYGRTSFAVASSVFWTTLFFLPAVCLAVYLVTTDIRVDPERLSWRTWRGRFSVPWSEVQDYYEIAVLGGSAALGAGPHPDRFSMPGIGTYRWPSVVITTRGTLRFLASWPDAHILRQHVRERSINAPANDWALFGTRTDLDWPRTFDYETRMNRWGNPLFRLVVYTLLIGGLVFAGPTAVSEAETIAHDMGGLWALTVIVPSLVYVAFFVGALWLTPSFAQMKSSRQRSIRLEKTGIISTHGNQQIMLTWSEIKRISVKPLSQRAAVESDRGIITFDGTIRDYYVLTTAIRQWAVNADCTGWEGAKPRTAKPVQSGKVTHYSYRTSLYVVYLAGVTLIPLTIMAAWQIPALRFEPVSSGTFSPETALADLPWLVPAIWGWWRFFMAGIVTDATGLTQLTLLGRKRILWSDVRGAKIAGAEALTFITLIGGGKRITYSALIANSAELADEIERQTGQKICCAKSWDHQADLT